MLTIDDIGAPSATDAATSAEVDSVLVTQIADDVEMVHCEQGDSDWQHARAGLITASMAREIRAEVGGLTAQQRSYVDALLDGHDEAQARELAGYKASPKGDKIERALAGERVGDYSATAKNYAFRLAVERISGQPLRDERFETYDMRRGHELEPDARSAHAFSQGLRIRRAGIARTRDGKFGVSIDGDIRVEDNPKLADKGDGGSEYKAFTSPESMRPILLDSDIADVRDQMQIGLWLMGRYWWHLGLYVPMLEEVDLDLTLIETQRDDDYIHALAADLMAFDRYVEEIRDRIDRLDRGIRYV